MHLASLGGSYALVARRQRYLVAAFLALFTLWLVTSRAPDARTLRDFVAAHKDDPHLYHHDKWLGNRKQFVRRAAEQGIYPGAHGYDGAAVRQLCAGTRWREGLVVSCEKIAGGIGNLKMRLLGCVRYAIEAGAVLVTPVIHPRQSYQLMEQSFGWDVDLPLDYMFDTQHFYATLAADCPQLRFVNESSSIASSSEDDEHDDEQPEAAAPVVPLNNMIIPPKALAFPLNPKALVPTLWAFILLQPALWRPALDAWLDATIVQPRGGVPIDALHPVRLSLDDGVQFSWPTAHDGPDFARDFGLAARFPPRARELAARVLYRLYSSTPGCRHEDPARPAGPSCFLGVHVRTEDDAAAEHWDSYETQLLHVREQLLTHRLATLYVATGKRSDVARLRRDVADVRVLVADNSLQPVRVLEKWDLVDDDDTMALDQLTWDQAAVVDYEVMLRASRFAGIWESSWSWLIALTRHLHAGPAWADPYQLPAVTYEDGLSIIYGDKGAQPMMDPGMYL